VSPDDTPRYLQPTEAAGRSLFRRGLSGPVVMLNLLRFRELADYSANPALAPASPISGAAAFELYVAHTLPFLEQSGGSLIALYDGGPLLVGPETEHWDRVMLVRQASLASFLEFAGNTAYLAGLGHRTAALEDSRLLPMVETIKPA